jgi:hypothetical protein
MACGNKLYKCWGAGIWVLKIDDRGFYVESRVDRNVALTNRSQGQLVMMISSQQSQHNPRLLKLLCQKMMSSW